MVLGTSLYLISKTRRIRKKPAKLLAYGKHKGLISSYRDARWTASLQEYTKSKLVVPMTEHYDIPRERALRYYFTRRWQLWRNLFPIRKGPDVKPSLIERITLLKERRISGLRLDLDRTQREPSAEDFQDQFLTPPNALKLLGFSPKKIITDRQLVSATVTLLYINNPLFGGSTALYSLVCQCFNVLRHEVLDTSQLSPSEIKARQSEDFKVKFNERVREENRQMQAYLHKKATKSSFDWILDWFASFPPKDDIKTAEAEARGNTIIRQWKQEEIERIKEEHKEWAEEDRKQSKGDDKDEDEEDEDYNNKDKHK